MVMTKCEDMENKPRYYYDHLLNECLEFKPNYCGVSFNKFFDLQDCEKKCIKYICKE